jgi:hypothetical protein
MDNIGYDGMQAPMRWNGKIDFPTLDNLDLCLDTPRYNIPLIAAGLTMATGATFGILAWAVIKALR